jgi:phospholipid/cholesterol/gamma-HCH transport system substrate-binding protein
MKFKMRLFADQIVGVFIIFSLVALAFVIVLLGKSQRWFAKDVSYSTVFPSAGGLSKNMAVQYKGFAIGSVKDFHLTPDNNVEVIFTINEKYTDRVKRGSIVELQASPIGLGNQFLFYAGKGPILEEGAFIPPFGSAQARELIRQGLTEEVQRDDSISVLLGRISSIMGQLDEALGEGTDETEIGKMIGSLTKTLAGVEGLPHSVDNTINSVDKTINSLDSTINGIRLQLNPILANLNALTGELNDPDGLIYTVLDTDKDFYTNLVKILVSVTSMIDGLDKTVAFIPSQLPQVAGLLMDLRVTMKSAEDVLTALTNNPLLRGGVPDRTDSQNTDISPRGIRF